MLHCIRLFFLFFPLLAGASEKRLAFKNSASQIQPTRNAEKSFNRSFFEQAVQTLKRNRKSLNKMSFPSILEKNICRILEQAKHNSDYFSGTLKESFFIEAIKTYGLVLEHSLDHNYFYCIYNYFESPNPKLILDLTKKHLSRDKRKVFLDRLETCHKVETFGNGDTLSLNKRRSLSPLALKDYMLLSRSDKLKFSNSLRKAYLAIEKEKPRLPIAFLFEFLIHKAFAQNATQCVIGGVLRKTVYSPQLERTVCSARNNICGDNENTFQCGVLFNSACIPLHPIKSVSTRCYQASRGQAISQQSYNNFLSTQNEAYHDYCFERQKRNNGNAGAGCKFYFQTIEELKVLYARPDNFSEEPELFLEDTQTESDFCEYCTIENNSQTVESMKTIGEILKSSEDSKLVKHLSEKIYQHSQCNCKGNDACTRGCKKDRESKERWVKVPCSGSKRMEKSTEYCMRHVVGTLVDTIDTFLKQHCDTFDPAQCLKIHNKRLTEDKNICTKSFVMPSALCALNLDGKDRYENIQSAAIKKKCRKHEEDNNKYLKTIKIVSDDGKSIQEVPLFEEIPLPENPDDLPTGSIVVMKSGSIHGHVEIKTDKKECDGKPCFCSDFCTSRSGGYKFPNEPAVVFRWNPKLIEYFGDQ